MKGIWILIFFITGLLCNNLRNLELSVKSYVGDSTLSNRNLEMSKELCVGIFSTTIMALEAGLAIAAVSASFSAAAPFVGGAYILSKPAIDKLGDILCDKLTGPSQTEMVFVTCLYDMVIADNGRCISKYPKTYGTECFSKWLEICVTAIRVEYGSVDTHCNKDSEVLSLRARGDYLKAYKTQQACYKSSHKIYARTYELDKKASMLKGTYEQRIKAFVGDKIKNLNGIEITGQIGRAVVAIDEIQLTIKDIQINMGIMMNDIVLLKRDMTTIMENMEDISIPDEFQ